MRQDGAAPRRPGPGAASQSTRFARRDARRRARRLGRAVGAIRGRIEAHQAWLERELADRDDDWGRRLREGPLWREREELLRSVPGIGPVVALTLAADLPELGQLDRKRIATLLGLAPLAGDSGTLRSKRLAWGGRGRVRAALYMAALVAARSNPAICAFYERLPKAGTAKKLALTACMHKLLLILSAVVRTSTPWHHYRSPTAA